MALSRVLFLLVSLMVMHLVYSPAKAAEFKTEKITLKGDFIQGGMIIGKVQPGSKIVFQGRDVPVSNTGQFVFGFHRDDVENQYLDVRFVNGDMQIFNMSIKTRDYKIQRIDGLPPKKVTPPESVLSRIREDNRQIKEARAYITPEQWFLEDFIWPSKGPLSGVYGSQRILNGQPRQPHYGVDVAAPVGAPVVAPASGIIRLVNGDMYYSGGTLFLDHGHGLMSAFLHLDKIHVKEGQFVQQGELIADVGKTGRVTGAHLDWRINWFKNRLDPQLIVPPMPK